jgi:hypothetical protein
MSRSFVILIVILLLLVLGAVGLSSMNTEVPPTRMEKAVNSAALGQ